MQISFSKALQTLTFLAICAIVIQLIPFSRNQKIISICHSLKGLGREMELGFNKYSQQEMDRKVRKMKAIDREFQKITGFISSDEACAYFTGNI
tara:strand:- start:1822 stop:2103 length:282 start_codon:yes stop_codon:yes gene_type:complete